LLGAGVLLLPLLLYMASGYDIIITVYFLHAIARLVITLFTMPKCRHYHGYHDDMMTASIQPHC